MIRTLKSQNPPDWQEILTYFRGSELQNYFTKILEDDLRAIVKPQYVDQIPKTVKVPDFSLNISFLLAWAFTLMAGCNSSSPPTGVSRGHPEQERWHRHAGPCLRTTWYTHAHTLLITSWRTFMWKRLHADCKQFSAVMNKHSRVLVFLGWYTLFTLVRTMWHITVHWNRVISWVIFKESVRLRVELINQFVCRNYSYS